jgi:hypothetical protein
MSTTPTTRPEAHDRSLCCFVATALAVLLAASWAIVLGRHLL